MEVIKIKKSERDTSTKWAIKQYDHSKKAWEYLAVYLTEAEANKFIEAHNRAGDPNKFVIKIEITD